MCLRGRLKSPTQPQAPGPTDPPLSRPAGVRRARAPGGEAARLRLAALFGAGSSTATDGSTAVWGCPRPPSPLARWLGPAARPPRRRSEAEAATCAPSAGGRRGRAAPGHRDPGAGRGRGRGRRVAGAPRPWRRRPALLGGPNGAPGCLPWFRPSRSNFGLVVNFKNRRVHIESGFLTFLFEMRDLAEYGTLGWS